MAQSGNSNVRDSISSETSDQSIQPGQLARPSVGRLGAAPGLFAVMGPSAILLATAVGSGEFMVLPSFIQKYGMSLIWVGVLGYLTQFIVNMEISRYTLATGETILTGFARLHPRLVWPILVMNIVPWIWPAWATGSSRCLAYIFGWDSTIELVFSILILLLLGLILTLGGLVYRTVLRLQLLFMVVIFIGVITIAVLVVRSEAWVATGKGLLNVGVIPPDIDLKMFITALAFAGAGGTLNLAQSYYVRDKQLGMSRGLSQLFSPLSSRGRNQHVDVVGNSFAVNTESRAVFNRWMRLCTLEHFITFFVFGMASVLLLSMIAYCLIPSGSSFKDMDFVKYMSTILGERLGPWARILYLVSGVAILASTAVGILDTTGRISTDVVKGHVPALRDNPSVSSGLVYSIFVWMHVIIAIGVLLLGSRQPLTLVAVSGTLNGVVMTIYCVLLFLMNTRAMPGRVRLLHPALSMSWWRALALIWAIGLYGYFSYVTIRDWIH